MDPQIIAFAVIAVGAFMGTRIPYIIKVMEDDSITFDVS